MHYLGKYGSQASRRAYDRIIAEFLANGRQTPSEQEDLLVEYLVLRFADYLEVEHKCCEETKKRMHKLLKLLNDQYGQLPISRFTPIVLKSIRRQFLEKGFCRNTINNQIGIIRQIFCWGCEEEIVPAEVAGALRMVRQLQKGRTTAIDYEEVHPVSDDVVEKTLQHIKSASIRDMIRLQRLMGGRPQDARNLRFCDIDRTGEIWKYTPYTHKTSYRGKKRELPIGPKAQQILQCYLDKCVDEKAFVFPDAASKSFNNNLCGIIATACQKAGVPRWSPNQLRHAAGTEIRDKFGLEYAQAALGHSSAKITEIYAKASFEKAAKVAKEIG